MAALWGVHDDRDQFFRIKRGEGEIWIDGTRHKVKADDGVIVPQGARYNLISTGSQPDRLCFPIFPRPSAFFEVLPISPTTLGATPIQRVAQKWRKRLIVGGL